MWVLYTPGVLHMNEKRLEALPKTYGLKKSNSGVARGGRPGRGLGYCIKITQGIYQLTVQITQGSKGYDVIYELSAT